MTPFHTREGRKARVSRTGRLIFLGLAVLIAGSPGLLYPLPSPSESESIQDGLYDVGPHPWEVASGDFDKDGDLDLAVNATVEHAVQILLGNGDGTFQDTVFSYWAGYIPMAVVTDDFDEDGILDLAVSATDSNQLVVLRGFGDGTFGDSLVLETGDFPINLVTDDINVDGHADLITSNAHSNTVGVYLGDGEGGFSAPVVSSMEGGGRSPGIGDLDEDGLPDVVLSLRGNIDELGIMFGDGTGAFVDPKILTVGTYPKESVVEDLNGDGHLDIAVACRFDDRVDILFGDGTGEFGEPVPVGVGVGPRFLISDDVDGDGILDLLATNYFGNSLTVLLGDGTGGFPYRSDFDIVAGPRGMTTGDFDLDGKIDLAICGQGEDKVAVALDLLDDVTPYLYDPPDGATVQGEPVFRWKPIPGATAYQVLLYDSADELVWSMFLQGEAEQEYSGYRLLESGTEYRWAVRERWQNAWNKRSDYSTFVVEENPDPLPPPSLGLPVVEQAVALPEYFSCVPLEEASSYELRLYADSAGTELLYGDFSATNAFVLPGGIVGVSSPGVYYWTVRGIDGSGYPGESSDLRPFVLSDAVPPPGIPEPVSPADDTLDQTDVTFIWEKSDGATRFELEFSVDSLFTKSSDATWSVEGITDTSRTVSLRQAQSTVYWHVRAENSGGSSTWSAIKTFFYDSGTVAPVQSVEITSPEEGTGVELGSSFTPAGFVSGSHNGTIEGVWFLNGSVIDSFSVSMTPSEGARVGGPVISPETIGVDTLRLSVISPDSVSSAPVVVDVVYPASGGVEAIDLIASPFAIPADSQSSCVVTAIMVDREGKRVYTDLARPVTFLVLGEGVPTSPLSVLTENGVASLTLQSTGTPDPDVLIFAYSPGITGVRTFVMTYEEELEEYVTRVVAHLERLENLPLLYYPDGPDSTSIGYDVSGVMDFLNQQILGVPDPPPESVESLKRLSLALTMMDLSHYYVHDPVFPEEDEMPLIGWGYFLDQLSGSASGSAVVANYLTGFTDALLRHEESTLLERRISESVRRITQQLFSTVYYPIIELTPESSLKIPVMRALVESHRAALDSVVEGADPLALVEDGALRFERQLEFMGGFVSTTQSLVDSVAVWASAHRYASTFEEAQAEVEDVLTRTRSAGNTGKLGVDDLGADQAISVSAEDLSLLGMSLAQGAEPVLIGKLAEISGYIGSPGRWTGPGGTIPLAAATAREIRTSFLPEGVWAAFGLEQNGFPAGPLPAPTPLGSHDVRRMEDLLIAVGEQGAQFEAEVRSILADVSEERRQAVAAKLPGLCDGGEDLLEVVLLLRGAFSSFAPDARGSVSGFTDLYEGMTGSHLKLTGGILALETAILDYLVNVNFEYTTPVAMQRGAEVIEQLNDLVLGFQRDLPMFFDLSAVPVVVQAYPEFPDSVGPSRIFTVSVDLVNPGAGQATDVAAVLGFEGPFDVLTDDTVGIAAVQAGDTVEVSWRLKVKSPGHPDLDRGIHPFSITLNTAETAITYPRFFLMKTYEKPFGANWAVTRKNMTDDRRISGTGPDEFALRQNVPNPFNPQTTISFDLPGEETYHVRLCVYNLRGRLVKTLHDGNLEPGRYSVHWDGRSDSGYRLGSGVYLYVLEAGEYRSIRKMILWE